MAANAAELLDWVNRLVPPRAPVIGASAIGVRRTAAPASVIPPRPKIPALQLNLVKPRASTPDFVELAYDTREWRPAESVRLTASLYEGYALQAIHIADAKPHPTKLVQSAAMAAVAPPPPTYRPYLPPRLLATWS